MKTLPVSTINIVNNYCFAYNEKNEYIEALFDFVTDGSLRSELVVAYRSARYIYKLGQGLDCKGTELHAHTKFQITQYASIYEAVIGYMLDNIYANHDLVKNLTRGFEYVPSDFAKKIRFSDLNSEDLYLCRKKTINKDKTSIKFDEKVDCCVRIGFIHESIPPGY